MKVFWSWQSDTPGNIGRHFVRDSLLAAIRELKQPEDVEEPVERDRKDALHLDHDRQGVTGSPDLFQTILNKIDASAVFVADVTPVSTILAKTVNEKTTPEKRNMNPNVAIELGYALKALSSFNVLMVLNTHYGDREFLPFDLAHKSGPIMFHLAPNADKAARDKEAAMLKRQLVNALRLFLNPAHGSTTAAAPIFNETPKTLSAAAYYQANETLAAFGEESDRVEYGYPDGNGFYLRLIPRAPLERPLPKIVLRQEIQKAGLRALWRNPSGMFATNRYGAIVVEPHSVKGGPLKASTQLFGNGEIWGVAPWLLKFNDHGRFIPGKAFEDTYRQTLGLYVAFMSKNLGIQPPYTVAAGAVGLSGFNLIIDPNGTDPFGPFYDDEFGTRLVLNDTSQAAIDAVLLRAFEELFTLSGYPRPQRLFEFPA
jgi:hypothetical protein